MHTTFHSPSSPMSRPQAPRSWVRGYENLPREHGFEPLRVHGRIPDDLRGTFYWNGPGQLSAFGEPYGHWFDGDGAVGAVHFGEAGAKGAVKLVQTRALRAEREAGKRLYSRMTKRSRRPLREYFLGERRDASNVNVVHHRGRLLALGSGRPVELCGEDLATLGEVDLDDLGLTAFSPHPHYSASRRALYNFGVRMGKTTEIDVFELPDGGRGRRLVSIPIAAPSFVHDCFVTERYVVILVPPLRIRALAMMLGLRTQRESLEFCPQEAVEILVVPIDAPERFVRVEVPAFYAFHFANAFDDGRRIVADLPTSPDWGTTATWLFGLVRGDAIRGPDNRMRRIIIDVEARTATLTPLCDEPGEMPRVSPNVEGKKHQYVYGVGFSGGHHGAPDRLSKLDVTSSRVDSISLGDGHYPSEAVVVPRGAVEDDAYLLTLVYDADTHTSHVAVLDASRPGDEPIARAHFGHHIPFHFHGAWVKD